MIGLDTNVIVRYVVRDDPAQSAVATSLIRSLSADAPGFIALIVVVELVWVLKGAYGVERNEIVRVLATLLRSEELIVERADLVWQAVRGYASGKADFADYVIERCGHAAKCEYTVTFDRSAAASTGMKLVG